MGHWLDELNPQQRQAVTFGDGPLLVIAGAGTGKTKTLACRVAYLIERGVKPDRIMLLTFTRRAAAEMVRRAGNLIGADAVSRVWGGTFHATANRLLRMYGAALELGSDFTVIDAGDAADLMNLLRTELGFSGTDRRFTRKETLVGIYSRTVNARRPLRETVETHFPWCAEDVDGIAAIFEAYVERKRRHNVLDYDDLLLYWNALCAAPRAGRAVAGRFDHVLVDEYQDTNSIQALILLGMCAANPNIMVVGDDAQSIYSFRSATIRNILDFPAQFPGAAQVTLEQNYRSTMPILAASNAVMAPARERYTKNLWSNRQGDQKPVLMTCLDENHQTSAVCDHILAHLELGVMLMHQAVLFRAGHHSAHLEIELARRNIPFHKYGGLKFVEAAHIKDVVAVLRILENPADQMSWFRVLQLLEGIGPKTAQRIVQALEHGRAVESPATPLPSRGVEAPATPLPSRGRGRGEGRFVGERPAAGAGGNGLATPLRRFLTDPAALPAALREKAEPLRAALAACCGLGAAGALAGGRREPKLPEQLEIIRRFCEPLIERKYDNAAVRLRDIEQLQRIAAGYRSRARFVADLTLDPPEAASDFAQPPHLEEDYLVLSTIHSAKGCEWEVVHVLHAADGMIPSDMATGSEEQIEEERRLFYVAMTRARNMLYVYFPLRYYHRRFGVSDAHNYAQLTRFITPEARACFEERGAADEPEAREPEAFPGASGVRAELNRLWRGSG